MERFPTIKRIIGELKDVVPTAMISVLKAGGHIQPHYGYYNGVLRFDEKNSGGPAFQMSCRLLSVIVSCRLLSVIVGYFRVVWPFKCLGFFLMPYADSGTHSLMLSSASPIFYPCDARDARAPLPQISSGLARPFPPETSSTSRDTSQ